MCVVCSRFRFPPAGVAEAFDEVVESSGRWAAGDMASRCQALNVVVALKARSRILDADGD